MLWRFITFMSVFKCFTVHYISFNGSLAFCSVRNVIKTDIRRKYIFRMSLTCVRYKIKLVESRYITQKKKTLICVTPCMWITPKHLYFKITQYNILIKYQYNPPVEPACAFIQTENTQIQTRAFFLFFPLLFFYFLWIQRKCATISR